MARGRSGVGPRVRLARFAALGTSTLSRLLRRGAGSSIGGEVALRIAPDILVALGRDRVLACVSATNGKTTATRLLTAAASARFPVVSNTSGANITSGLVAALCAAPDDRPAVLEVDELYLAATIRAVRPKVVVLLNLSRDQLDRTAEPARLAASWRSALADPACEAVVVANCDDPRVAWAASAAGRVVWVGGGRSWEADAQVCPRCGRPLSHGGDSGWHCGGCGLARPVPDVTLSAAGLHLADGSTAPLEVDLPGRANRSNAAMAAIAASELGVPVADALRAMRGVHEIEGRYAERTIGGQPCRLILAKNPAGWSETLDLVSTSGRPLLLSVNARQVDGRDTSWLYDVPFEQLVGRRVTVTGAVGVDLSLRLGYAGVAHEVVPDKRSAVVAAAGGSVEVVDTVGDYSSFQELRALAAAEAAVGAR